MTSNMNEKLKEIEKVLLEERSINLGKRHNGEYIIYNFYNITPDNSVVKRACKEHYTDSSLKELRKCSRHTLFNKSLRETIDVVVYNLLLKGYEVINIDEICISLDDWRI